jgi:AraC-like DNA-binding protein
VNEIQSSFYSVAIALCLFSTGIVGGRRTRSGRPFAWFTVFLGLETVGFVLDLLVGHPAVPYKALWLGLRMGMSLLLGPCLWLTVREGVDARSPHVSSLGRWPVIFIALGMASTLPVIQSAHPGTEFYSPLYAVSAWHSRFIHTTMLMCMAVFAAQGPVYLARCRRLLRSHEERRDGKASGTGRHLLLVIVFTTWLVGVLRVIHCASHSPPELAMAMSLLDVSVAVGALYTIVRRVASAGPPASSNEAGQSAHSQPPAAIAVMALPAHTPTLAESIPPPTDVTVAPISAVSAPVGTLGNKYARCPLPSSVRGRIRQKLDTAMHRDALYRESLLSLRSLSARLGEKPHYVSQVINQDLETTFYEFVNRHRVIQAGRQIVDDPARSVLEIALAVGFNSKSTFNAAFRRHFGLTPRQFRVQNDPQASETG